MKKQITLSAFLFFTIKIFSQFTSDIDTALWYLDGKDSIYVLNTELQIDVQHLPDGLYQLKLSTRAGPLFTSFIKSE